MTTKRRKTFVSVTAVLVALAILLTGTFAWVSISQEALNEKLEDSNPGGRLHDDYDGTNKDVYVENFGAAPIFARIRLDEYMEIGAGAGLKDGDEGYGTKSVTKVGNQAADINDTSTWTTHIPNADDTALCDKGFHDYIEWTMGGSTTYMPTFNKNKDSLKSDINGTFAGPDEDVNTKEDQYADYIDYSDPANASKTDDAVYDNDDNNVDEGDAAVEPDNITKKEETHEVQTTLDATVLTMEEWKAMGSPMGNYWVYDTDGWAYWALPIQPGKATGLLLDGLTEKDTPQERWYYAINVVAQFATAEDIDKLENTTPDAGKLLEQATNTTVVTGEDGKTYLDFGDNTFKEIADDGTIGNNLICGGADEKPGTADDIDNVYVLVPASDEFGSKFLPQGDNKYLAAGADGKLGTDDDLPVRGNPTLEDGVVLDIAPDKVTVSTKDGADAKVKPGKSLELEAVVTGTVGGEDKVIAPPYATVTWSVSGGKAGTTIDENGVLTVASDETADTLTVTATSDPGSIVGTLNVNVMIPRVDAVTVKAEGDAKGVVSGKTLQLSADVTGSNLDETNKAVTWSVSGGTDTAIDENGLLTVATSETTGTVLTVTATSVFDSSKTGTYQVTVSSKEIRTIDGIDFYVMATDTKNNRDLLWAVEPVGTCKGGSDNVWSETCNLYIELQNWLNSTETLKDMALDTTIYTRASAEYTGNDTYNEMTTNAFLLSQADLYGNVNNKVPATNAKEYTWGTERLTSDNGVIGFKNLDGDYTFGYYCWLRSPCADYRYFASNYYSGVNATPWIGFGHIAGLRPALWVSSES